MKSYDFKGWATRHNVRCSDGRIITEEAFKHNDGQTVPLVWMHQHNDPLNVLGHALLEYRKEGVYAYCTFNDTERGQFSKELVKHGDICQLSIYANQLKQEGSNVLHGAIREVSLVYAGANPGAYIESVIRHGADEPDETEVVIYTGENFELSHSDEQKETEKENSEVEDNKKTTPEATKENENKPEVKKEDDKTLQDVFDTLNDEQKDLVYALVAEAIDGAQNNKNDNDEGDENMKHNVFDTDSGEKLEVLSHSEMQAIIADAKKYGSMKESALAHGIENIGNLYPYVSDEDGKNLTPTPVIINKKTGWVQKVMAGVHKTPFSRVKALFADITAEEARARGYIKGKQKKEEVFSILKRTTSPQTVYKLQKIDRDDIIDIVDMDTVAFIKQEMRGKLDEEIAGAILVGDGRLADADDKIKPEHIRPIWTDDELFAIHSLVNVEGAEADMAEVAAEFVDQTVRAKEDYAGSGSTTMFMADNMLSACLLLKDENKRRIYKDVKELATAMMVSEIVTVPVMKGLLRDDKDAFQRALLAIEVNLDDYNVGADKGGAVNMFDDFDIDYNKYSYLIETRCSGALVKPKSAIVYERMIG